MSFMDQLKDKAQGMMGHEGQGAQVMGMLTHLFDQSGGVKGFIEKFQNAGLGETIKSWVSKGENLPISSEQIQKVFGSEQLQKLGQKFGMDSEQISSQLANHMPNLVDKLSPDGSMPSMDQLKDKLSDLKNFFSK